MRRVLLWGLTGAASVVATLGLSSVAHAEPASGAPQVEQKREPTGTDAPHCAQLSMPKCPMRDR